MRCRLQSRHTAGCPLYGVFQPREECTSCTVPACRGLIEAYVNRSLVIGSFRVYAKGQSIRAGDSL